MSLTSLVQSSGFRTAAEAAARAALADASTSGVVGTLAGIAVAAKDSVSATVSFSSGALEALEQVGESAIGAILDGGESVASAGTAVLDGAEDVVVGAWHTVRDAAVGAGHLLESGWDGLESVLASAENAGESAVDAIERGVGDIVSGAKAAATGLGHYAAVALEATGSAVSDVASGAVMVAAAGGKSWQALL